MDPKIEEVVEYMGELEEDPNVPKNIKNKFSEIISELKNAKEENLSLTINKLLSDLDEISGDANLDQFTRQQIWSISSMLEGIDS